MVFRIITRIGKIEEGLHEDTLRYDLKILGEIKTEPIIADKKVSVKAGDIKLIKIRKIKIPPYYIVMICPYARHKLGSVIAVGESIPMPIDTEREADFATFASALDGEIKKDDLLGVLLLVRAEKK
ncbi:DUF22 domain-containing protein [Methanocaldococcus infernus]